MKIIQIVIHWLIMALAQLFPLYVLISLILQRMEFVMHHLHEVASCSDELTALFTLLVVCFSPSLGSHRHLHGHKLDLLCMIEVVSIEICLKHAKPLAKCFKINLSLTQ